MNQGWLTRSRKPPRARLALVDALVVAPLVGRPLLAVRLMPSLAVVVLEDEEDRLGLHAGAGRRNRHAERDTSGRPRGGPRRRCSPARRRTGSACPPRRVILSMTIGQLEVLGDGVGGVGLEEFAGVHAQSARARLQHVERGQDDVDVGAAGVEAGNAGVAGEREGLAVGELALVRQELRQARVCGRSCRASILVAR